MKHWAWVFAAAAASALPAAPAAAKVAQVSQSGFVVRHIVQVPEGADETWAVLIKPAAWWDAAHTWSSDAANLSIDARAGGCFCEILPNAASPKASPRGTVEHMRVVYIERPRALRMVGALGPLQSEAANATLTIQLKPGEQAGTTQVLMEYVVGGFTRTPFDKLAPAVDAMLGAQMRRLAETLGGAFAAAFPGTAPAPAPAPAGAEPALGPEPEAQDPRMAEPAPAEGAAEDPGLVPLAEEPPAPKGPIVGR
ncbi:SRPBCC family protein [Novosphingobium soli]|uniref:SRPBCC family protein n=1 Tax=Novosphingobium soli TaxID=574956 RepID=A0ABV6CVV7_9SPHN